MRSIPSSCSLVLALAALLALAGCSGNTGNATSAASAGTPAQEQADAPDLIAVDTGETLSTTPGDGVGVFVEYAAGGHWHVFWTCDTNKTNASCTYTIGLVTRDGSALANIAPAGFRPSDTLRQEPSSLVANCVTDTGTAEVRFDTAPGTTIEVDAAIGGIKDSRLFYFVEAGKLNGGRDTSTLTDPLLFGGLEP
jgi:hypothetical protein